MSKSKDVVAAGAAKAKKDEPDHELEGLMSEIETDLRSDELRKIWKSHGSLIIAFVVLLLGAVVGVQLYRQYIEREHDAAARRYELAVKTRQDGKTDDALKEFGALVATGGKGYGPLARLNQAALQVEKKDIDGALANYKALAADATADPALRDLATVLFVLHSMDRADPKTLEAELTPLTNPSNAFSLSALELQALLAAKQNDMPRAVKTLEQIMADPAASAAMRERVGDLVKLYQAGIMPPPPAAPTMPAPATPASTTPAAATPAPTAAPPAAAKQ